MGLVGKHGPVKSVGLFLHGFARQYVHVFHVAEGIFQTAVYVFDIVILCQDAAVLFKIKLTEEFGKILCIFGGILHEGTDSCAFSLWHTQRKRRNSRLCAYGGAARTGNYKNIKAVSNEPAERSFLSQS